MKTKLKWLADEAEHMEPEWAAGMPEAPGRGGTGKMTTVLGMIHKVEPDPACLGPDPAAPLAGLAGQVSGEKWVGTGEVAELPLFCSSHTKRAYKGVMSI